MPTMPQSNSSQPQTPPSPSCDPEYIAIILAATQGARLFPLTSEYPHGVPKHLLPLSPLNKSSGDEAGGMAPLLQRLLVRTYESGFDIVVVAIHEEDGMTVPFLLGKGIGATNEDVGDKESSVGLCKMLSKENEAMISTASIGGGDAVTDLEFHGVGENTTISKKGSKASQSASKRWMHVRVVRLPEDCHGSADALRFLSQGNNKLANEGRQNSESTATSSPTKSKAMAGDGEHNVCFIPRTSHAVVMPGDLIMEGALVSQSETSSSDKQQSAQDGKDVLSLLVQAHRRWNADGGHNGAACTMLLTDVGAEDKEGVPLKESSKAKMGLQSREEEDMEYVGLSSEIAPPLSSSLAALSFSKSSSSTGSSGAPPSRRVVLKRSKLEVEEDEGTGSTPKLVVPKRRLHAAGGGKRSNKNDLASMLSGGMLSMSSTATIDHSPTVSLRTDLHDVHLYVISNWVFELMHARPSMQSFQSEVLPLLISRQYRGVEAAFGPTAWKRDEGSRERLRTVLKELDGGGNVGVDGRGITCSKVSTLLGMYASGKMSGGLGSFIPPEDDDDSNPASDEMGPNSTATPKAGDVTSSSLLSPPTFPTSKHPFAVSAQVLSREASKLTLRACTLPSLLYGCGEITSRTLKLDTTLSSNLVPKGAKLNTKFNSILMPGCTVGEKVQTKSCSIGANVTLGDRAKLNNVVVLDGASIGSNTVLQNSVVGVDAKVGENCNLKDCQVGPGAEVAAGTRTSEKGETFEA